MESQKFSIRARINSFRFAVAGIWSFIKGEHNARVHLVATVAVIIAAVWTGVSGTEAIALVVVTGLVWIAEMFNTCMEKMMDFISTEQHPVIGYVKDLAAAAVLVAALLAVITGLIIFIPKWIIL